MAHEALSPDEAFVIGANGTCVKLQGIESIDFEMDPPEEFQRDYLVPEKMSLSFSFDCPPTNCDKCEEEIDLLDIFLGCPYSGETMLEIDMKFVLQVGGVFFLLFLVLFMSLESYSPHRCCMTVASFNIAFFAFGNYLLAHLVDWAMCAQVPAWLQPGIFFLFASCVAAACAIYGWEWRRKH